MSARRCAGDGSARRCVERDVSDARALPELEFLAPTRFVPGADGDPDLDANAGGIAARLFGVGAQLGEVRLGRRRPQGRRSSSIRRPISRCAGASDHDVRRTRSGCAAQIGSGLMPASSMWCHCPSNFTWGSAHRACMTRTCSSDRRPDCKILVETDELHLVPADPDPQPKPAAAEHVKRGGLLGDRTVWR